MRVRIAVISVVLILALPGTASELVEGGALTAAGDLFHMPGDLRTPTEEHDDSGGVFTILLPDGSEIWGSDAFGERGGTNEPASNGLGAGLGMAGSLDGVDLAAAGTLESDGVATPEPSSFLLAGGALLLALGLRHRR